MDEDLKSYLDQQFSSMKQGFDGQMQQLRQEMNQRFDVVEGDVRQAHVLIEGLQGQIRLVADGIANCNEQLQRHREEVSGKLGLCEDLDLRVRRLEAAGDLPPTGSLRRSRAR
jgi:hypothetical protein